MSGLSTAFGMALNPAGYGKVGRSGGGIEAAEPPASVVTTVPVDPAQLESDRLANVAAANNAAGRGSTFLTSGLGAGNDVTTTNKKLLGQ